MQNDLISRSSLTKAFEDEGLGDHSLIESVLAAGVYAKIENAPPVDAVQVVHAYWREHLGEGYTGCSKCDFIPYSIRDNYCPNCGAKMDLQEVETGG